VTVSSSVREYSTEGLAITVLRALPIRFRPDRAQALKYLDSWFFKGVAVLYARFASGSPGHVMLLPQRLSSTAARSRGRWRPLAVPLGCGPGFGRLTPSKRGAFNPGCWRHHAGAIKDGGCCSSWGWVC